MEDTTLSGNVMTGRGRCRRLGEMLVDDPTHMHTRVEMMRMGQKGFNHHHWVWGGMPK